MSLEAFTMNMMVSARLLLLLLTSVHLFFIIWTSAIDVFSSHQQTNVESCETLFKHFIEIVHILVALTLF